MTHFTTLKHFNNCANIDIKGLMQDYNQNSKIEVSVFITVGVR